MSGRAQHRLLDGMLAALLGGGAFTLYVLTLAPTVLAGDGGEFQFASYLLGVAHPTGYPLYVLLGWAWSHLLPLGDVAYRLNLFSAFWAALAVGLLYPASRSLLRQAIPGLPPAARRLLGTLTAVTFAVTPTLWAQAVIAEVYSLHIFFVVLLIYLLLGWGERVAPTPGLPLGMGKVVSTAPSPAGRGLLLLAAFFFGLSLTHHSTMLLLAPALLAYVWLTDRRVLRDWRRLVLPGLALVLLPLILYLYIPWRAPHTPYLRLPLAAGRELVLYENSLSNLVDFVTGGPFGGSLDLSVNLGERLRMAWGFLLAEVGWIGVILALLGVVLLALRRRWALLALTGLAVVASVAFNLVYTIGDIFVLYIPTYLIVVLWLGVGAGGVSAAFNRRPVLSALIVLPFFVLPLWMTLGRYVSIDQSHNTRARTHWEAILTEPLPPGAILISDDRNNIMPLWYFQYVDGVRPDLLGLFPLITPEYPTLAHVLDLALSTGRPIYLVKEMPGVEVKVDVEPEGLLWRVLGLSAGAEPDHPTDARLADAVVLDGHDRTPHSPRPGETMAIHLYWEALRPLEERYHSFVHLVDPAGEVVAQSDHQPGGLYYPTTIWQPGERLRDDHRLDIPAEVPAGVYQVLAGMYALSGDGSLTPLGEPVSLGQIGIKAELQTEPDVIDHTIYASFDDQIELIGYNLSSTDGAVDITLHWRAVQVPENDYTVFVHLLDGEGNVIAQHDGQPQGGTYPTSVWDDGEVVADDHPLVLPPDLSPGDYRLRVGLYRLETGERLPVAGGGDSVELELSGGD
jgi:hypothetical protein